jgi:GMP reductase
METFDFHQVRLLPKKGIVDSRDECDTSIVLGKHKFNLPIVPANMLSTINEDLCIKLAKSGNFYIYHRFHHNNYDFVKMMNEHGLLTSISVGVNEDSYSQLKKIKEDGLKIDMITVDVAHGFSIKCEKMCKFIVDTFSDVYLIAGNVCTPDATEALGNWGASCIKVGLGNGSACQTYKVTSFGSRNWQASCLLECSQATDKQIMCDGAIKEIGSIAAAITLGSDICMLGNLVAGHLDSPGSIITDENGKKFKEFFGSSTVHCKKHDKYEEGCKLLMDYKDETLLEYYDTIGQGLRSAISYAGGKYLGALNTVKWVIVK